MDSKEDPERADALEQFKKKLLELREMEAKLKTLRLDIKGLQKDFDTTEENIKALQSVGQIIGEVLKQLDEERCQFETLSLKPHHRSPPIPGLLIRFNSHRQSLIRSPLRRWLSIESRQSKAEARHSRRPRYDYPDNNANVTARSRSSSLQHVAGRSRPGQFRRYRRS